jgi:hypothetical protein
MGQPMALVYIQRGRPIQLNERDVARPQKNRSTQQVTLLLQGRLQVRGSNQPLTGVSLP